MAQQTALDEFVDLVRVTYPALVSVFGEDDETSPVCIDGAVGAMLTVEPGLFSQALQDPRYLAYCKEQDVESANRRKIAFFKTAEQDRKPSGTSVPAFDGVIIKPGEGRSWHGSVEIVNPPTTEQDRKEEAEDFERKHFEPFEQNW